MDVIYGLMPLMIFLGLVSVVVLFWAARSGQFDDMDGDASRILMDEDIAQEHKQKEDKEDKEGKEDSA